MRQQNPTKTQVKSAASKIARIAWKGTKATARGTGKVLAFTGRTAGRAGVAAARVTKSELKQAICAPRKKNPTPRPKSLWYEIHMGPSRSKMRKMWTTQSGLADAKQIADVYAKAYPRNFVEVRKA